MELFFTDHLALQDAAARGLVSMDLIARFGALSVPDTMPFFLDGDGDFPPGINEFLRDLPCNDNRSRHSWRAAAYDLKTVNRFMERRGRDSILDATFDDLRAFKVQRRGGPNKLPEIEAKSWNRAVFTLEKLFDHAVSESRLAASPFKYSKAKSRLLGPARGYNTLLEPVDEDGEEIKCISDADYFIFRDVGLRGLMPDRVTPAADARGHNDERDALIADFMVSTGARVSEAASALVKEIPPAVGAPGAFKIANAVAKRLHGRSVYVGSSLLDRVHDYVRIERSNAVLIGREKGFYAGASWIHSSGATEESCRIGNGRLRYGNADVLLRRRLLQCDSGKEAEPAALWLSHDGLPVTDQALRAIFSRASKRCQSLGFNICVTPHVLRHTFAVWMLSILVNQALRRHGASLAGGGSKNQELWDEATLDPLRTLQRMLGHKRIATTYVYLTVLEETKRAITAAFETLDRDLMEVASAALRTGEVDRD